MCLTASNKRTYSTRTRCDVRSRDKVQGSQCQSAQSTLGQCAVAPHASVAALNTVGHDSPHASHSQQREPIDPAEGRALLTQKSTQYLSWQMLGWFMQTSIST